MTKNRGYIDVSLFIAFTPETFSIIRSQNQSVHFFLWV